MSPQIYVHPAPQNVAGFENCGHTFFLYLPWHLLLTQKHKGDVTGMRTEAEVRARCLQTETSMATVAEAGGSLEQPLLRPRGNKSTAPTP